MKLKQIDESGIFYIPAGPDRKGLNPETAAALTDLFATAAREISERNPRAQESANVWADAFERGGEECFRWAGARSRKKRERAGDSSQSIASCGNDWPNWLLFQMKR